MAQSKMLQEKINPRQPPWWENIFVVFTLLVSTNAIFTLWQEQAGIMIDPVQGNILMQILWILLYCIILVLLIPRLRQVAGTARQEKFIWLLVGLAFLSVTWSETPFLTFRGSVALLVNTVFGAYLVTRYSRQQFFQLLAWTLGLGTLLSLALALLLPEYAFHFAGGPLRGVYSNKNHLGPVLSLAAIVWFIYSATVLKKTRLPGFCLCGLAVVLLYMSNSTTSWIGFIALTCLLLSYPALKRLFTRRPQPAILITLASGLVCLGVLLFYSFPLIVHLLGKDLTFNGRTPLWTLALDMVRQSPWLGYGYNAFWLGWEGPSAYIWELLHWHPPHAHNGFLDIWLELGLVGLVLFINSLVINLYKSLRLFGRRKNLFEMLPLLLMVFMVIHNLAESTFMVPNNFFWILYAALSFQLHGEYKKEHRNTPGKE